MELKSQKYTEDDVLENENENNHAISYARLRAGTVTSIQSDSHKRSVLGLHRPAFFITTLRVCTDHYFKKSTNPKTQLTSDLLS